MIGKELKDRLRRLRQSKNMTQEQVAEYLGLSRSAYTYYETGKTEPSIQIIIALSELYKISTDEILLSDKQKHYLGK